MYVWCEYKWMCQRMMDDQGNALHPRSLTQPAQSPHLSEPALATSSVREKPFSVQRSMVLKVIPFLYYKPGCDSPNILYTSPAAS